MGYVGPLNENVDLGLWPPATFWSLGPTYPMLPKTPVTKCIIFILNLYEC